MVMVTKAKTDDTKQKVNRVKVEKLKLQKETVRDLTAEEIKKVRGGSAGCKTLNKEAYKW
jgi:hypothetical protein